MKDIFILFKGLNETNLFMKIKQGLLRFQSTKTPTLDKIQMIAQLLFSMIDDGTE